MLRHYLVMIITLHLRMLIPNYDVSNVRVFLHITGSRQIAEHLSRWTASTPNNISASHDIPVSHRHGILLVSVFKLNTSVLQHMYLHEVKTTLID